MIEKTNSPEGNRKKRTRLEASEDILQQAHKAYESLKHINDPELLELLQKEIREAEENYQTRLQQEKQPKIAEKESSPFLEKDFQEAFVNNSWGEFFEKNPKRANRYLHILEKSTNPNVKVFAEILKNTNKEIKHAEKYDPWWKNERQNTTKEYTIDTTSDNNIITMPQQEKPPANPEDKKNLKKEVLPKKKQKISKTIQNKLLSYGYDQEEVSQMTKEDANRILEEKIKNTENPHTKKEEGEMLVSNNHKEPQQLKEVREAQEQQGNENVIQRDVEQLSKKEQEQLGFGLSTIGFKVEEIKNKFWANGFSLLQKITNKESTVGKFIHEMENSFVRDAKSAVEKAKKPSTFLKGVSNIGLLSGNILRYGRIITDFTGASLASPVRYVMMAGMVSARVAEAGKEVRLKNKDLLDKTRIHDIEIAEEEAWAIYEDAKAQEKKEGNEEVSAEALQKAYMMRMPKDIQKRLEEPSTASGFVQGLMKKHMSYSVSKLNKKIEGIESNTKLSHEEKEKQKENLLLRAKKNLDDYDRMVTRYGTVDVLSQTARYAEKASKAIVTGLTIETLYLSVEKLYGNISHIFASGDAARIGKQIKDGFISTLPNTGEEIPSVVQPPTNTEIGNTTDTPTNKEKIGVYPGVKETAAAALAPTIETPPTIPSEATIGNDPTNWGISQVHKLQIENNPELAKTLGYDNSWSDVKKANFFNDLEKKFGYIDENRNQLGVKEGTSKIQYALSLKDGKVISTEYVDGVAKEVHHMDGVFESNYDEPREYLLKKETPKTNPLDDFTSPTPLDGYVDGDVTDTAIKTPLDHYKEFRATQPLDGYTEGNQTVPQEKSFNSFKNKADGTFFGARNLEEGSTPLDTQTKEVGSTPLDEYEGNASEGTSKEYTFEELKQRGLDQQAPEFNPNDPLVAEGTSPVYNLEKLAEGKITQNPETFIQEGLEPTPTENLTRPSTKTQFFYNMEKIGINPEDDFWLQAREGNASRFIEQSSNLTEDQNILRNYMIRLEKEAVRSELPNPSPGDETVGSYIGRILDAITEEEVHEEVVTETRTDLKNIFTGRGFFNTKAGINSPDWEYSRRANVSWLVNGDMKDTWETSESTKMTFIGYLKDLEKKSGLPIPQHSVTQPHNLSIENYILQAKTILAEKNYQPVKI